jgi:hypothetical protein
MWRAAGAVFHLFLGAPVCDQLWAWFTPGRLAVDAAAEAAVPVPVGIVAGRDSRRARRRRRLRLRNS